MMRKVRYEELRVEELFAARAEAPLAYFPIGSLEYHGFHLPFGFDAMHAHTLCIEAAQRTGGVVLPATWWGTEGHVGWEGSLLLSNGTIAGLVADVFGQLDGQGFKLIVACTGHYPDVQGTLIQGLAHAYTKAHPDVRILVVDPFNLHPTDPHGEHAGLVETSTMLHLRPELVDMAQLETEGALKGISEDCVDATVEYGAERFEVVLDELVRVVNAELEEVGASGEK